MPPVQAGILPSAFPALSPPSGVRSSPRCAASCGVTAPKASGANSSTAAAMRISVFIEAPPKARGHIPVARAVALKRVLDAGSNEVAIVEQVVPAGAAVLSVRHVEVPPLWRVGANAHRDRMAALEKVPARAGRDAAEILRPGDVRQDVHRRNEIGVLQTRRRDIPVGPGGREPGARLVQARVLGVAADLRVAAQVRAGAIEAQAQAHRA